MYRVLIADDEPLEREGLELIINNGLPDLFTFSHAENGRMAIELAEKYQFDIIFMDIKMPGIQGLEAIEVIRKSLPLAKIIIVSAYDYFSYAKTAISLGVKEYILKPAKREQIIELLKKLIIEVEQEKQKRSEEIQKIEMLSHFKPFTENELSLMIMLNIIQDLNPNELVNLLEFEIDYGYCIVAFIDSYSLMEENEQKRIYELVKHYMKNNKTCIVSPIVEGKIAIFTPIELNRDSKIQDVEIFEEVERLKEYLKKHIPNEIRFGLGSIQKGIDGWRKSYFEAVYIFKEQEEETKGNRIITKQSQIIQDEVISICSAISMIDLDTSLKQFNLLFDRLANEMKLEGKSLKTELLLLINQIIEFLLKQNFKVERFHFPDVDELDLIKKVSEQQIIKCIQVISKEKETRLNHFVEIAKTYIHENYKEDISLVQIASYVNLNPFYFSKMFKKKTGETFSDYVMKVRIEFAKQLMLNENLNLKEISYQIGFKDPNYFSRVFKKYTNESPKLYRQKVLELKLS